MRSREMLSWLLGVSALALAALAAGPSRDARRTVSYPTRTMGTTANLILVTSDSVASAPLARRAHRELHRIDSLMSNWTTTSEVARLNRDAARGPTPVHPEVATVVDTSLRVWKQSGGAFDITVEPLIRLWGFLGGPRRVPSQDEVRAALSRVGAGRVRYDAGDRTLAFDDEGVRIDLGGIAKGYAVDAAARVLATGGAEGALVDLSGNMFALGRPPKSDHWRIGIRDPRGHLPFFARLELHGGEGISTSGKYEQFIAQDGRTYGHIMDPRTGWPVEGLISVTVVAGSAFAADAWDTPLFVLGPAAARATSAERADIASVLVSPGAGVDTVYVESALRERFVLEPAAASRFHVRVF